MIEAVEDHEETVSIGGIVTPNLRFAGDENKQVNHLEKASWTCGMKIGEDQSHDQQQQWHHIKNAGERTNP